MGFHILGGRGPATRGPPCAGHRGWVPGSASWAPLHAETGPHCGAFATAQGSGGAVSAAHTKRETAQSTFSRDSRGFSLRCQGPSAGCVSVPSLSSGSPVGRRLSPWSTVETGTRAWASSEAASAGRQWQPQPLLCAQHCGGCGGPRGGGDSHPELGHDARAQMPDGIAAPRGVLQGFGGGTGVARADGAPTPRAREEAGRGGLEFDPNGIIKRRNF